MGEGNVTLELKTPTTTYTKTVTIKSLIQKWGDIERERRKLELIIPQQEERLRAIKDKLSDSGILSSIIQQTGNMDMPRGSDVTDRVGNLVANASDGIIELELKVNTLRMQLAMKYVQLADIELTVSQFKPIYQEVMTKYYRDGFSQQQVADALYLSRSMVEKILCKAGKRLI